MASLRVKPVILGRKSDLTEQHLKLPSKVTHSIYFPRYLCMNFPERHPKATFNCPSNDPQTLQVMSYKNIFSDCLGAFGRYKLYKFIATACWTRCINWLLLLARVISSLTKCPLRNSSLLSRSSSSFFFGKQVLVITCNRRRGGVREYAKPPSQLKAVEEALAYCL